MGSESSNSDSNSSKSDSDISSNSADNKNQLETMVCHPENENTMINRVWIAKKSISMLDEHVNLFSSFTRRLRLKLALNLCKENELSEYLEYQKLHENVFNKEGHINAYFKHWALILELSNSTYVNIQFGRNGFSLKEFNKSEIEGENLLNSILDTWGEKDDILSFCYLGESNYEYEKLKIYLKEKKDKEKKKYEENNRIYYNACFNNCQHFCCEIEKVLFGSIQIWHSFYYYLNEFYITFFPSINITELKLKYEEELKKKNDEIFKRNLNSIINDKGEVSKYDIRDLIGILFGFSYSTIFNLEINNSGHISFLKEEKKDNIKKIYSLDFDDYADFFKNKKMID